MLNFLVQQKNQFFAFRPFVLLFFFEFEELPLVLHPHLYDLASAIQRIMAKERIVCRKSSRHPLFMPAAVKPPAKKGVLGHSQLLMFPAHKDPLARLCGWLKGTDLSPKCFNRIFMGSVSLAQFGLEVGDSVSKGL